MSTDRWSGLPDFPWDLLAPYAERARAFPGGAVDLSVGTPVDPTPESVQRALREHANAPGYPTTAGIPALAESIREWAQLTLGSPSDMGFLPTIGTKEIIAGLPYLLGMGPGDHVVIPEIAYPTYAVGAIAAGAAVHVTDSPEEIGHPVSMVWINSPSNPTGAVMSQERLAELITWARAHNVLVFSDECYFELGWDAQPVSILDTRVNGGDLTGLVAVHSLSKRSNMAGYRFGFLAGDPRITDRLLGIRKHLGMMLPSFVQVAAMAAYSDPESVAVQRAIYARRRDHLMQALASAGFAIEHSEAGLYIWATRGEACWETVSYLADRGIVATPGDFYGAAGAQFVRIALTASDADIARACERLAH